MSRAWMPIYIGDYLADTLHLTTTQHGAYLLLIMHYWQHGGLPSDEAAIAGISRLNRDQWRSNCSAIAGMFEAGWKHKRIDRELKKANELSEKRAMAGRAGADRTNRRLPSASPASARQMPTQSQSPKDSSLVEPLIKAGGRPAKEGMEASSFLLGTLNRRGWAQ